MTLRQRNSYAKVPAVWRGVVPFQEVKYGLDERYRLSFLKSLLEGEYGYHIRLDSIVRVFSNTNRSSTGHAKNDGTSKPIRVSRSFKSFLLLSHTLS